MALPGHRLRTLHLFAGAGGGILADLLLGHVPVCAVEIEAYPRSVLLARQRDGILPRFPIWDDVCTFDGREWRGAVDIVAGGFPCQDISCAGKGEGLSGARSGLWSEMARIIGEVRPRFVFVENSPMLTSRGLGVVLGDLAALGYDARWGVLGARHAGAPHRRDRIWIVAHAERCGFMGSDDDQRKHATPREPEGISSADIREPGKTGCSPDDVAHDPQLGRGARRTRGSNTGSSREREQPFQDVADANSGDEHGRCGPVQVGRQWGAEEATDDGNAKGTQWGVEPNVGRVADGVASMVDRLRAIGNGQVPQVAALAWEILR